MTTSPQYAGLNSTNAAIQALFYESGYAQKEIQILLNASKADLSDPNVLAEVEGAYQFFEALKNCTSYTDPVTGKVMDFSVYGKGGLFGDQTGKMETLVDNVLKSFNNIKMPDPSGGSDTVYDSATGKPATLYDLLVHPSDGFYFKFNVTAGSDRKDVPWCNPSDNPANSWSGPIFGSNGSTRTITAPDGQQWAVQEHNQNVYGGAQDQYTVSGSAAAIEAYASVGASDPAAAASSAAALDAFLSSEM